MAGKTIEPFVKIAQTKTVSKGEKEEGVEHVQQFLERFGYIEDRSACAAGELDDETSKALSKYQECHGLTATGEFDQTTRDQMTTHRCGFPDLQSGVAFSTTCRWNQDQITYAFDTGTDDVAGGQEFQAVRDAFDSWAAVIPVTFQEVGLNDNPDVLIGWRPADDPDLNMEGGTLAHADFPPDCSIITTTLPKPVHFDDTEHDWVIGTVLNGFDVESVALHEIGHILGLAHSNVGGAVMFPSIGPNSTNRVLQADDISGIQSLYGAPAPSPSPTPTPSPQPQPQPGGGGCFIATAAYGSEMAAEVNFLRTIRDQVIRQTKWGDEWFERFEQQYYRFSPAIAAQMRRDPELKDLIRFSIVEPWTRYLKLAVSRPDWDQMDWEGLDPRLRDFLHLLKSEMDEWLGEIELPQSFEGADPIEAVRELNFALTYIKRSGGMDYLRSLADRGQLPLSFRPSQQAALTQLLQQAGRSEDEIQVILCGRQE